MKQWLGRGGTVEVTSLAPRDQVGGKSGTAGDMLAQLHELIRKKHIPAKYHSGYENQQECGKNSLDAPGVKFSIAESVVSKVFENDG